MQFLDPTDPDLQDEDQNDGDGSEDLQRQPVPQGLPQGPGDAAAHARGGKVDFDPQIPRRYLCSCCDSRHPSLSFSSRPCSSSTRLFFLSLAVFLKHTYTMHRYKGAVRAAVGGAAAGKGGGAAGEGFRPLTLGDQVGCFFLLS